MRFLGKLIAALVIFTIVAEYYKDSIESPLVQSWLNTVELVYERATATWFRTVATILLITWAWMKASRPSIVIVDMQVIKRGMRRRGSRGGRASDFSYTRNDATGQELFVINGRKLTKVLDMNEQMYTGETRYSNNREFFLTVQGDNNICVYRNGTRQAKWCSMSQNATIPRSFLIVQGDGHLCQYPDPGTGRPMWCNGMHAKADPGLKYDLWLTDDGTLTVLARETKDPSSFMAIWSSDKSSTVVDTIVDTATGVVDDIRRWIGL